MVSVASTSATMDLTAVLPALMEGIAQEVGVDMNKLKVVLVGDEIQLDVKPFQILREQDHQVEWEHKKLPPVSYPVLPTMQPHVEIRRKNDAPFFRMRRIGDRYRTMCVGQMEIGQLIFISGVPLAPASAPFGHVYCGRLKVTSSPEARPDTTSLFNGARTRVSTIQNYGPGLRFRLRLSYTFAPGERGIHSFVGSTS